MEPFPTSSRPETGSAHTRRPPQHRGRRASAGSPTPRPRRRKRLRWSVVLAWAVLVLAAVLVLEATSWGLTMLRPSSLPISLRTIEWVRDNNGAWLVNLAERVYYTLTAPVPGGSSLDSLPVVGATPVTAGDRTTTAKTTTRAPGAYVPPVIAPVITPGLKGEGAWRSTGPDVNGAPPLLVTVFRPEPAYPRQLAYVAWLDTTRTQLALYPGRVQPPDAVDRGPMQVPAGQRQRVLATFNSGFTYKDSQGGFAVNGQTIEPMVAGQGTVIAYKNGRVDVMEWQGGATVGADVVLARQNLPLIVADSAPNPQLNNSTHQWGQTLGNAVRVWRSGLGVDARGNLIYLAAPGQTAPSLAAALIQAGAVRAMELDINQAWPSFITYGASGAQKRSKLVPTTRHTAERYLTPDDRDFFALYRRIPGGDLAVPLR